MRTKLSRRPARMNLLVNDIKGAQSGGSLQSMFEQYMLPPDEMHACQDPFCLDSCTSTAGVTNAAKQEGTKEGDTKADVPPLRAANHEETDQFGVRYNKQLNKWTYPFQFSPINSRVVRRTCSLLGAPRSFKCV
jgi:hypothetical protein